MHVKTLRAGYVTVSDDPLIQRADFQKRVLAAKRRDLRGVRTVAETLKAKGSPTAGVPHDRAVPASCSTAWHRNLNGRTAHGHRTKATLPRRRRSSSTLPQADAVDGCSTVHATTVRSTIPPGPGSVDDGARDVTARHHRVKNGELDTSGQAQRGRVTRASDRRAAAGPFPGIEKPEKVENGGAGPVLHHRTQRRGEEASWKFILHARARAGDRLALKGSYLPWLRRWAPQVADSGRPG